jgi:NAD(P)-dependent dehydrogenase (short-subunit alcohol dehydrogenase family)
MKAEGIALVTGASRGIGRALVLELAASGFEVVATMRDPAAGADLPAEAARRGGCLRVERLDVTRPETIEIPAGLRVLVNNAGVEGQHHPVELTPAQVWRDLVETNLLGAVSVTSKAIARLREGGGGVVCTITSLSLLAPMPFFAPYRATKAALSAFGESLRAELAQFGIRVVEIMPGPIDTDMYRESERPLEALEHPAYRDLAQRITELRAPSASMLTPVAAAAREIVNAILDDGGPLRHSCDPLGAALLERWRSVSDEEMMRSMLGGVVVAAPDAVLDPPGNQSRVG